MRVQRSLGSIIFRLILFAFGWTVHQGCSNVFGTTSGCATAPPAIESWASLSRTVESARASNDRANFEAFLTKHANALNKRYGWGCETPLHSAARLDRGDIAPLLIARSADFRALDRNGEMPIHTAAKYGSASVVKLLLAAKTDVNAKGPADTTPLHFAVNAGPPVDPRTRRAIVEALLLAGADVNAKQAASGYTPLRDATLREPHDESLIELLLKHGADVRAVDHQDEPLFVTAVSSSSVVTVRRLLDRGADVNAASRFSTALASAAGAGNVEVVALLIDRGADVNRRVQGSRLIWEGLPLALTLEVFGGIDKERVPRKREAALALIVGGADVNARNASGETMLHFVTGEGNMPAIELLLSHGAAVSPPDHAGFTPLHRAIENGRLEAATRLVAAGADTRAATIDGRTPLSLASSDREMAAVIRRHAK